MIKSFLLILSCALMRARASSSWAIRAVALICLVVQTPTSFVKACSSSTGTGYISGNTITCNTTYPCASSSITDCEFVFCTGRFSFGCLGATITNAQSVMCSGQQACQEMRTSTTLNVDCAAPFACLRAIIGNDDPKTTNVNCAADSACHGAKLGTPSAPLKEVVCGPGNDVCAFDGGGGGDADIYSTCLDCFDGFDPGCGNGCNYNNGTNNCNDPSTPSCMSMVPSSDPSASPSSSPSSSPSASPSSDPSASPSSSPSSSPSAIPSSDPSASQTSSPSLSPSASPSSMPSYLGACCLPEGGCKERSKSTCKEDEGGKFLGQFTTCDDHAPGGDICSVVYGKCPKQTTPMKKNGSGKCEEGQSLVEFLDCTSGMGFDDNGKNFNIIQSVIEHLDMAGAIADIEDSTFYVPFDYGVGLTASALGFDGDRTNEKLVSQFLIAKYTDEQLKSILLYHVGTKPYMFMQLQKEKEIDTLEGESIIVSQQAKATPNCDMRVRLRDAYREQIKLAPDSGHAKIHNRWQDIWLSDGNIFQTIKALLLPAAVLPNTPTV